MLFGWGNWEREMMIEFSNDKWNLANLCSLHTSGCGSRSKSTHVELPQKPHTFGRSWRKEDFLLSFLFQLETPISTEHWACLFHHLLFIIYEFISMSRIFLFAHVRPNFFLVSINLFTCNLNYWRFKPQAANNWIFNTTKVARVAKVIYVLWVIFDRTDFSYETWPQAWLS